MLLTLIYRRWIRKLKKDVTVAQWCGLEEETRCTWIHHWHLTKVSTPLFHSQIVLTL